MPAASEAGGTRANSSSPLTFRASIPADFETLHRIDQECFPRGIAYSRRTLRWFLALPGADCLVAEHAGNIVAFILSQTEGAHGQIITLDVVEAYRRAAVGSQLLLVAESRMQAAGVHTITLETATTNEAAVAFWKKHGYRTEAVVKNYYPNNQDAFQMSKALPAKNHSDSAGHSSEAR